MKNVKQINIADYHKLKQEVLLQRIAARKEELRQELLLLCHHYQQDDIFQFADYTGDSLKLAHNAAQVAGRRYIIFCGVHFMAESADILTDDEQIVILPDLTAGCSMADMATSGEVKGLWRELAPIMDTGRLIPITYVNSSASLKAFVGEHGGSVCTSSNAERVLNWALEHGERVFFCPDEHLGRNSAQAAGIPADEVVIWRRGEILGGNRREQLEKARIILWDGYCTVHMQFSAAQIISSRQADPEVKIIVHPECRREVVEAADLQGSTEMIIKAVSEAPAGSSWAVGTEINLVKRLTAQFPDKHIRSLSPVECKCSTMYRIDPAHLLWVLDNLAAGRIVNQIKVDKETAALASLALNRMLKI